YNALIDFFLQSKFVTEKEGEVVALRLRQVKDEAVHQDKYCQAVMFTATMTSSIYIGGIGKPAERVKLIIIMYS
ncbi:unnamed protein product, partial [Rotaria sp. Silwood2]